MEGEGGLDEGGDAGGRVSEFAEESSGFEGGHGLFDESADLGLGPVHGLLTCGKHFSAALVGNRMVPRAP